MAVEVVDLSSDSEDEGTEEKSILRNECAPKVDAKNKGSISVEMNTVVQEVTTRVRRPKPHDGLPVEEMRRLVKGGEWKKLKVPDLQSYAREQGLTIGGTKQVLINRIKMHIGDSEDEGTEKESILSNKGSISVECKTVARKVTKRVRTPKPQEFTTIVRTPKPEDVTTRVRTSKPRDPLPVEEVRRLVKGGEWKKVQILDLQFYARRHRLIIGGRKHVLIDRIRRHIEILEQGVNKYNPESFTKNCSGDVCEGDVIIFKQRVYDNFILFRKNSRPAGMRMVAGRVVKESYGDIRGQHTFTVEVLWSSGYGELAPMQRLQIKGRNLYRFGVRRQDERKRLPVLQEKHERGAAARRRWKRPAGVRRASKPVRKKRKRAETCRQSGSVSNCASAVRGEKRKVSSHPTVGKKKKKVSSHQTVGKKKKKVSSHQTVGKKKKKVSCQPTVGKKRKRVSCHPTAFFNRTCQVSRSIQPGTQIHIPGWKLSKTFSIMRSKQLQGTGGTNSKKRSKAVKKREKMIRERREADRLKQLHRVERAARI